MYVLEFVNQVRAAQSYQGLAQLPPPGADGSTPLELAMGCRLERGVMRLSSPQAAAAVADATGLPVATDLSLGRPPAGARPRTPRPSPRHASYGASAAAG